jgi:cytochrome c biogenesis protein CcmG, thiol:disulfide interchange protein DsbE
MSNRPNRRSRPGSVHPPAPDRGRVLLIAGVAAVVAVALGVVIALAGGGASTDDDRPDFGPVAAEATPLPELGSGADPAVGQPAARLEGLDPEGEPVSLPGSGEPTIVAFLAHWCPHCQVEVPVLVDLQEEGELDGIRLVGVLTGTDANRPNHPPVAWLEREGWTAEVMLDDERGTAASAYGLSGFPFLVYLDGDGDVVARTSGEVGREALLELIEGMRAVG